MMPTKPTFVALALAVALAPCVLSTAARAQVVPVDPVLRDFESSGNYVLTVDGKAIADAEIFENSSVPAVLVIAGALPTPVLLRPGRATVETVSTLKVARQNDGTVALLADAELLPLGTFRTVGASVTYTADGRRVSLDPKPPLLGLHGGGDLQRHDPAYTRGAAAYQPSPTAIGALRAATGPVTVRVFFGSWCTFCKQYVPRLLALQEALVGSNVAFEYFGLPSPPAAWKDPEAVRLKVGSVPTAIVSVNGKAVSRIAGPDWSAPEVELARIVNTWK